MRLERSESVDINVIVAGGGTDNYINDYYMNLICFILWYIL